MNKKNTSRFNFVIGTIWIISAIINAAVAFMHFYTETPLGYTYVGLALLCTFLAIFYISMGIKKRK